MSPLQLRPDVYIHVTYGDQTAFGSAIGQRADESVREIYAPVLEFAAQHGYAALGEAAPSLLAQVIDSQAFAKIADPDGAGAWRLKPDVLFPDPASALPTRITLIREDTGRQVQAGLPADYWGPVHDLIATLCGVGVDEEQTPLHPDMRALLELMRREDLLALTPEHQRASSPIGDADLTFVGHNTVVLRSKSSAVIVDPLLFAGGTSFPEQYQPLRLGELGHIDAILITHSHVDHFDSASLLRFPLDTKIVIPSIERETLLTVDVARRLRDLGFTDIVTLDWWRSTLVGDMEVHALPFHGEQPTDGHVLHPAVRNVGNTYVVRTATFSAAFLADSGRDSQGDVRDVAVRARAQFGPVDVLFSGYRGWLIYPVQHLFSSVARYMPFVPPSQWTVRQQLMTGIDGAIDLAERWGARYLVPYADGGAPWHWRVGLGPRLDADAEEMHGFDPFPERVQAAAGTRTRMPDQGVLASPVRVLVLRPGDSLAQIQHGATLVRVPDHAWPYADQVVSAVAEA